jgi:hypothetical protein
MNDPKPAAIRADDLLRHLKDLRTGTYEGVRSRSAKEEHYRKGIELLTPVAVAVLEEANALFLQGTGEIQVIGPEDDGSGGLETRFELSWPQQRAAYVTRGPREPLQKGILAAIVELELHQRIFETDWHILPVSQQSG